MPIAAGDPLPAATLTRMGASGPEPIATADYFAGRRIALFSVPGAFTPTCSAKHLPGFIAQAGAIRAKGIDAIACTAVNDIFVLTAWAQAAGAEGKVEMLADGNGDFVRALGLQRDSTAFGMGMRGQRFAMIVADGVVERIDVEQGGEFRVSSADHLLSVL